MNHLRGFLLTAALVLVCCSTSSADVLYDGSLNSTPNLQGWYFVTNPFSGAQAVQTPGGGATNLDSTPQIAEAAGYFSDIPIFPGHPGVGVLDSSVGFALTFDVQLVSEDHSGSNHRAGFSVIVMDSAAKGVELGFWTDEIWAQTDVPLFEHSGSEQAAFDTTAAITRFKIIFSPGGYLLLADGTPLFGGALKDYSAFDASSLPMDPYETPSFIFLGDDTSSASAEVNISRIELIPEPSTAIVLSAGFFASLMRSRRRRRLRG
jgi:hypothetical protein